MFCMCLYALVALLAPVYSQQSKSERQVQFNDVDASQTPNIEGAASELPYPGIGNGFFQYGNGNPLESRYPGGYGLGRFYRPNSLFTSQPQAILHASSNFVSDRADEVAINGYVIFKQYGPQYPVVVSINATGLPPGKHALHIHAYGDLKEGCKSTGPHFQSALIGNIDVKEDGLASLTFQSPFLRMAGPRGIIGRSIVLHEKPIEANRFPDIYGAPLNQQPPTPTPVDAEENAVGSILACGIITVTDKLM